MRSSFTFGVVILIAGGILSKVIGGLYKIPLTNILGAQGIGLYYLIFPIYSIAIVLCSSGVGTALCNLVAKNSSNRAKCTRYLKASVAVSSVIAIAIALFIALFSKIIAYGQGEYDIWRAYLIIAPAIIFVSIASVINGYFRGFGNMVPTTAYMVIEQLTKLAFGLVLATKFLKFGVIYSVYGAIIAICISEFLSLVVVLIYYAINSKKKASYVKGVIKNITPIPTLKTHKTYVGSNVSIWRDIHCILSMSTPYILTSIIAPIMAVTDSFLVVNLLKKSIGNYSAVTLYGLQNGVVATLISLPNIIVVAITSVVMPKVSKINTNNKDELTKSVSLYFKLMLVIILPVFVVYFIVSPQIISVLYKGLTIGQINQFEFASKMLTLASISIVYSAFLHLSVCLLYAIGARKVSYRVMLCCASLRLLLVLALIPSNLGVFGVVLADIIYLALSSTICIYYLNKKVEITISKKSLFIASIATFVSIVVGYCFKYFLLGHISTVLYVIIVSTTIILTYIMVIAVLKYFSAQERLQFGFSKAK